MVGRAIQGIGAELGETSAQWGAVRAKLQQEQNEMEALSITAEYDNQVSILREEVKRNPDPLSHETLFLQGSQAIQRELDGRSANDVVRRVLATHATQKFAHNLAVVRSTSLELFSAKRKAWFDMQEDDLANRAAERMGFPEASEAIALHTDLANRMEQQGLLVSAEQRIRKFKEKTLEKNMDFLSRTDFKKLFELEMNGTYAEVDPEKRAKYLEAAMRRETARDTRNERLVSQAKKLVMQEWESKATLGQLTDAEILEAKQNKNPFVTAYEAVEFEKRNAATPTKEMDLAVAEMAQRYYAGTRSIERVARFRRQAEALAGKSTAPSVSLSKFLNELQTDESVVTTQDIQRESNAIAAAKEALRAVPKTAPPIPFFQGLENNERKAAEAEAGVRIRKGEKREDVVKDIQDRWKAQREGKSTADQDADRLTEE